MILHPTNNNLCGSLSYVAKMKFSLPFGVGTQSFTYLTSPNLLWLLSRETNNGDEEHTSTVTSVILLP